MKIYTKTGDAGDTSLLGGTLVPKSSIRIDVCGTIDELNAQIGVIRSLKPQLEIDEILEKIQSQLFILGTDLSAPLDVPLSDVQRIKQSDAQLLEKIIDRLENQLETLTTFIYPCGTQVSAQLHVARGVCRRAERLVDALGRKEKISPIPLIFLNRLADLLFVLARYANKLSGISDIKWDFTEL